MQAAERAHNLVDFYLQTTSTVSEVSRCRSPSRYLMSSPLRRALRRWKVEQSPFTVVEIDLCGRRPALLTKPHRLLRSFSLTGTIFLSIHSHFARIQSSRSQYCTSTKSPVVVISTITEGLLQKASIFIRPPLIGPTVMTSHAADTAHSIQISSQNIRIRR